jgi:hypothetical protein
VSPSSRGLLAGAVTGAVAGAALALVPGPWDDLKRDGLRKPLFRALSGVRDRLQGALAEGRRAAAQRRSFLENIQS